MDYDTNSRVISSVPWSIMKIKQQDFHGQIRVGEKLSGSFDFGQGNSIIFSSQEI